MALKYNAVQTIVTSCIILKEIRILKSEDLEGFSEWVIG